MSDHVFVEEKPMAGKEHPLQPGATIGREGCDIVLADPEVSRRHASIRVDASGPAIEDHGSTNGTYVNDQRIEGVRSLSEGDTVRFGNTVWRLQIAAGATRAVNVPAASAAAPPGGGGEDPTAVQPAAGPPQVTAAAPQPAAVQAPAPPAAPAPAGGQQAGQALSPEQVAASAGAPDRRGDVPKPADVTPSAIRRVLPPPPKGQAVPFSPGETPTVRGSAATRLGATVFAFLVTALTAVGVVLYLVLYEP
jgi:predicted component of type VI protein secretion system